MMLFSVQSGQRLDRLLLGFYNKTKILTEYYENSFNVNIDRSTCWTSKEKARKLGSTTNLNLEENYPSFHNGAVPEKVFK